MMNKTKYIFVIGGVMSGIGKGITTASTALVLKNYGFSATAVKIDPYFNVDAGTLNPVVHGEVFVTDDGTEADQDLGNYERFLGQNMASENIMTSGLVYQSIINKERNLEYDGSDVQMMHDIPVEVVKRIESVGERTKSEFVLIEVGGTAGDVENLVFLEAARIMRLENPDSVMFMLVTYLPVLASVGEMKTKPTQHAVRALNSVGIQPDMIIARASVPMDQPRKEKISRLCNIQPESVISAPDIGSIYEVPINFERDHIGRQILARFNLEQKEKNGKEWQALVDKINTVSNPVKIGIVGKYFESGDFSLTDAYLSVIEAIKHAAWSLDRKPEITWISSEKYEEDESALVELKKFDGVIVPGGFGTRGIEGKIKTIQYLRENEIPFLGLCYGLQLATVEFARNVAGISEANTIEAAPGCTTPVISTMEDQKANIANKDMGGTMRLGAYDCQLQEGTKARELYGEGMISERHRHRYEVNNKYRSQLEEKGLVVSGINPQKNLVEIIELPDHPFFVATQFHPELKSRPLNPHPLFKGFIEATIK